MLLLDYMAYGTADAYIEFINALSWFRMYCAGKFGKNKTDYLDGFTSLENRYRGLWFDDEEEKNFSEFIPSDVEVVLEKVRKLLNTKRLEDNQITEISNLLFKFLNDGESKFRDRYFDYQVEMRTKYDYPAELFRAVKELLDDDHNDEAVLTSFKYLDNYLQKLLGLSSHEIYGEDLINKAFAPNTGLLQLDTNPNEQIGLRNFVSGANAIFRNPSAHRFMQFENFEAATIVAMVAVMARIANQLVQKNQ